jgi:hypothetical protein
MTNEYDDVKRLTAFHYDAGQLHNCSSDLDALEGIGSAKNRHLRHIFQPLESALY